MRYLLIMGGGFLIFGLFWSAIGVNAEGRYGGGILIGIGIPVALMGLILVLIYMKHRIPTKPIDS
jgi:hypothetical protein